ncbi:MAG: Ig-like domain-containing protein [Planctomycetota bacterium]|nr:Ig-like domain-containing protein [Planctomycetota bacterium]
MTRNTKLWATAFYAVLLLAVAGCGDATLTMGTSGGHQVTTITSPFQAAVATPFVITGGPFLSLAGTECQITFEATAGTPFADGTSATATVVGTITSDTTVEGTSPTSAFGSNWDAHVTVALPSGFEGRSATPIANFIGVPPADAVNDAYSSTGNVRLERDAALGLLANDTPPSATVTSFQNPSTNGGDVNVQPDGSFTYDPPIGFTGTDTFTYEASSLSGSDVATVTITVSDVIWFIDGSAAPGGDGRQISPFNTTAAFMAVQGVDALPGHWIYYYYNGGAPYTDSLTLLDDQVLVGQGVDLQPGADVIVPASSPSVLNAAAGDTVTLAANNTVRGLDIRSTAGTAIFGGFAANLTLNQTAAHGVGGPAVNISGGGGTFAVTFSAITSNNSPTNGISIDNAGGSFTSEGTTSTNAAGAGIRLDNNSGSFSFNGVTITGTTGRGIHATSGGTLSISGTMNTITTTTGTALEVDTVTIGALGLTFESVSSNGAASGIVLSATGTSGGLTVTGDGSGASNGSGGSIDNSTTDGIRLTNCQDVSITQLDIDTSTEHGVQINAVQNFTFQDAQILNAGANNDQHAIDITNGHGTFLIEDVFFNNMNEDGVEVVNTLNDDATRDDFTLRRLTFRDHTAAGWGEHCVDVNAQGTSEFDVLIDDCDFDVSFEGTLGVNCRSINTGNVVVTIQDCLFESADAFGSGSVQCVAADTSTATWNVLRNDMNESPFTAILINNDDSATSFATVRGNDIDFVIASHNGFGISMRQDEEGVHTALIEDNTIDNHAFDPVRLVARDSVTGTGTLNATIRNNTWATAPIIFGAGVFCDSRDDNTLWLNATGNNIRGTRTFTSYDDDFAFRQDDTADLKITQLDPTGPADPNRLDTINNGATNGTNGTILWNQGAPPLPPVVP